MRAEQLFMIYRLRTLKVPVAVRTIGSIFVKYQVPLQGFRLDGRRVNLLRAAQTITKEHFDLVGHGFDLDMAPVTNSDLDIFSIVSQNPSRISWDDWVTPFIDSPNFVMAWVVDCEYDEWQIAEDLMLYQTAGRPYDHLPLRSNGLPYPLEDTIVDISRNPGRWRHREGYIEAVGAEMWLGAPFWKMTGADQAHVESTRWLRVSRPAPSILKLEAADRPFTSAEGEPARLQEALRSLLYPRWQESWYEDEAEGER
jgi:hypothetical protein